jgi:uncharacterized membrane protein YphA (DoxX/SURF4 family)
VELVLLAGKVLFATIFVSSGISHFKNADYLAGYAQSKRVPRPKEAVLASGALLLAAPVLFFFGIIPTLALFSLAAFLIVTALVFHDFWNVTDANAKVTEQIAFFKDLSLAGAVLIILSLL